MLKGDKIVYARKKKGLLAKDLAEIIDIDRTYLSKIENSDSIPATLLPKIAAALDVPIEFFERDDVATPEELNLPKHIMNLLNDVDGLSYFVMADQARRDGIDIETLRKAIEFAKSVQPQKKDPA